MKRCYKYLLSIMTILILTFTSACSGKDTPGTNEPEPPKPSAILDSKQPLGDSSTLFYLPNETVEAGVMQNLSSFQGDFLLCQSEIDDYTLKLISASTGKELISAAFTDIAMPYVQVCGDKIALTDWFDGEILILDETLQELDRYQVSSEYNSMYVSPDAEKVYVFHPENGIHITTLATGETEILLQETAHLYPSDEFKSKVTFSYTDLKSQFDMYGALDLETGDLIEFPFEGSFFNLCFAKDTWFATHSDGLDFHYIGNKDCIETLVLGNEIGNFTISPETGHLLLTSYNSSGFSKMTVYDAKGKFISECVNSLENAIVQGKPFWSEVDGGYYFIMLEPGGKDMLMFWDIKAECVGNDLPLEPLREENLPEGAVSKELYNRAKELSTTYGITIRIAEQIWDEYPDYSAEVCLDEETISNALDDVEKALSVYPEGFFSQLLYGSIRKVELHLTGALTKTGIPEDAGLGFTSFAGFATLSGSTTLITIDIFSSVESNMHHELFHLIDNKLEFDSMLRPQSNYSEENWAKLNPEDFEYANQLYNLPISFYDGQYEEWFTGYYARTNAKEDRATIMEYAGMGDHNMFILAPYRQAKLEYLSECIRDAFDTTGWPEVTVWEDTLNRSK